MKYKRSLSILLAAVLLLSTAVLFVHAVSLTDEPVRDVRDVISEDLLELLEQRARQRFRVATHAQTVELPMEEQLPVSVWLTGIDADAVEAAALEETGWNRDLIRERSAAGEDISSDDVDAYIEAERRIYAQQQRAANEAFLASCPATLSDSEASTQFVSAYAPMVLADASDAAIWTLAEQSEVENISYAPEMVFEDAMDISVPLVRGDYIRDTMGYTGKGVKIGQIEFQVPEVSHDTFRGVSITLNTAEGSNTSIHATAVAEIMVSSDSERMGLAPDAELYCTGINDKGNSSEAEKRFYKNLEWLLTQGVHVINLSMQPRWGASVPGGSYTRIDRWADHIAITHSVHFVTVAGNGGGDNFYVANPGMGYNVITVGNLNDADSIDYGDDVVSTSSNYWEKSAQLANKPDLVAPGNFIETKAYPERMNSGTSFAAPHVTGIIAQLLEQNPSLKVKQDAVKAILTAAINHSKIRYTTQDAEYDQCGAGCVDARASGFVARQNQYVSASFGAGTAANRYQEYPFTVKSSDDLKRISLAWLKYESISSSNHAGSTSTYSDAIANLDFEIINASGTVVARANLQYGNVEIVQLNNPAAGAYTIRVYCRTVPERRIYFGLAWW